MKIDVKGAVVQDSDAWIYEWLGMSFCSPSNVQRALAEADGGTVDVEINSGGGDIFAASEIYTALRNYRGELRIHVTGMAGSAASVIACAGKSDISPTAMVMVHNVSSGGADGDYHVKDKESEILRKANEAIAAAYTEKTGMSREDALAMMDRETWMTAADAVKAGLIDEIAQPPGIQLSAAAGGLLPPETIRRIRNTVKSPAARRAQAEIDILRLKGEQTQ